MKNMIVLLAAVTLLAVAPAMAGPDFEVVVHIETPPIAWGESHLADKLQTEMSRSTSTRIYLSDQMAEEWPDYPTDRYHIDSLVNWGLETGKRYLLAVYVQSERIERRKTFSLPMIFHRYETIGLAEGEFRFIDLSKRKQLIAESFKIKERGKRVFQGSTDDDINDPDIHLTAYQKIQFLANLEEKLSRHLVKKIRRYVRGR
ncbi:MAG: hypothetical protein KAT79_06305 [candidate division Zixibacteria bacterium]|nr:hypothetical protein [candidate division Zixibacteria bacterium]